MLVRLALVFLLASTALAQPDSTEWQTTDWGTPVNGLRMRVTVPREVRFGDSLPAICELDWVGLPYQPHRTIPLRSLGSIVLQVISGAGSNRCNSASVPGWERMRFSTAGVLDTVAFAPFHQPCRRLDTLARGGQATFQVESKLVMTANRLRSGWVASGPFTLRVLPGSLPVDTILVRYHKTYACFGESESDLVPMDTFYATVIARSGLRVSSQLHFVHEGYGESLIEGAGLQPFDNSFRWLLWNMTTYRGRFKIDVETSFWGSYGYQEPQLLWRDTIPVRIVDKR